MKKIITTMMLLWLALAAGAQQVLRDDWNTLQLQYTIGNVDVNKTDLDGRRFVSLGVDGSVPSAVVGAPCLPLFSTIVEVPLGADFEVAVSDAVFDTLTLPGQVAPRQPSRSKSDTVRHALAFDKEIYRTDAFYGAIDATVEPLGVARDRRLARLQFSPMRYNPVTGQLVVCRKATVTVRYAGADRAASLAMFERYHSPAFHSGAQAVNSLYPKSVRTAAPVRYLIVANSMFRGQLDNFVAWKKRKGFLTDIVYTDDPAVGTTTASIQAYIQSQYSGATAANPAPTYLLLVGDHEQLPAFSGTTATDHITDLYYTTWTSGDHLPDCYHGRFSAQSVAQLTPQIQKTLMYEQYTFADPTFLDRAVMVAGVDGGSSGDYGYTHADPAMDYAITNYVNGAHGYQQVMYFKNNTSIVPSGVSNVTVQSSASSMSATVRGCYNQGAGLINYSAHGSSTSWGTPNFTTSHVASMTNAQKFGLMIGNCCLTNKFEVATCFGESLLRKDGYCGAVGYIGGSNSTYWYEDFYWAVGIRSSIGPTMSMAYNASNLGVYDRAFHTHGEAYSQWVLTQGDLMFQGNMSVEGSSSGRTHYYWEIYHLMGDPSVMPYLTQAQPMTISAPAVILAGATTYSVTVAPYAYVALTDTLTRTLRASGYANANGQLTLTLPAGLAVGGYELAASAQQYRTTFLGVSVTPSSGPYVMVTSVTPTTQVTAGASIPLNIKVVNMGNSIARNVVLTFVSDNAALTLNRASVSVGNIAAGDSVTVSSVTATVGSQAADQSVATVTSTASWTGSSTPVPSATVLTVNAPSLEIAVADGARSVTPGAALTLGITLTNSGHATLGTSQLTVTTGSSQLTATLPGSAITLAAGASVTRQLSIMAAASMTEGVTVPVYITVTGAVNKVDTLDIYIGQIFTETFEGGFNMDGWTQGDYPWELTTAEHVGGVASARSCSTLSHNQTSEMTLAVSAATADSVSFWYKVSSETNYDKFHFYIDGVEKIVTSGQVAWTRAAYALAAGDHLLKFSYSKDGSVSSYSDCAWVDDIVLPRPVPSYMVSVVAAHGTPAGAGSYRQGDTATVGVFPNAGYAFIRWNDGTTLNPRNIIVNSNMQLTATLTQGGSSTIIHDTAYINVHDTTYVNVHDTAYVNVHDTTYVNVHDTTYVNVHDTAYVTIHDTTYVTIYDTTTDTIYQDRYVYDTLYVTSYVHDTTYIGGRDTLYLTQYVHDTTYIYLPTTDTVTLLDTVYLPQYLYDTTIVVVRDTLTITDTVLIPYPYEVPVHDTTVVEVYIVDTLFTVDTFFTVDTLYLTDTLYLYDTVYFYDTVYVYDTIYVPENAVSSPALPGARVYQQGGEIVVESTTGAPLPLVTVYDAVGRRLTYRAATAAATDNRYTVAVPATGVYLVRVGDAPACRVAVVR